MRWTAWPAMVLVFLLTPSGARADSDVETAMAARDRRDYQPAYPTLPSWPGPATNARP